MSSKDHIEFLIPQDIFGCIMGEGGGRIKEVREACNVRIGNTREVVNMGSRGFRHVSLTGSWVDMWNALCQIMKTIHDDEKVGAAAEDVEVCLQLRVSQGVAGAIIGKSGANLKGWRQDFPVCKFNVDDDAVERKVRWLKFDAKPETMCEVLVVVADFLEPVLNGKEEGLPVRDLSRGGGKGKGKDSIRRELPQMVNNRKTDFPQGGKGNDSGQTFRINDFGSGTILPPGFDSKFETKRRRDDNGFDDRDQKRRREQPPIMAPAGTQMLNVESRMVVDEAIVGKVMGRGGSVINNMCKATGCAISTDKKGDRTDGRREITVVGSLQSAALALGMIHTQITSTS